VKALYIEVYGILNGLGPELEVEAYILEERSRFIINSLSELFCRSVYLRDI
jgi:hypothetical protein